MFLFVTITAVAGGWLMSPFVISKTFEVIVVRLL